MLFKQNKNKEDGAFQWRAETGNYQSEVDRQTDRQTEPGGCVRPGHPLPAVELNVFMLA